MNESEVFAGALQISDPADLDEFLDRSCEGNREFRFAVEKLLEAHRRSSGFLERCPALFERTMHPTEQDLEPSGSGNQEELSFLKPPGREASLGRLGHYEILDVIGRGGMGIVLRGFDEKLQRIVAIKVMASVLASDPTAKKRFIREARAAAAISHDHVVTIHAVEEMDGRPYLVMNYVAGQSLEERIKRTGPLQLHEILRIGMQIATGLAAAHCQGIVHRDIKPANILLENSVERVKITDFGLARATSDPTLTHHGTMTGTPSYMAPEQVRGEHVDHRADLFSLGSVLYAMCTGRAPFRGGDTMAVLKRVCDEKPEPIQELSPDAPMWLAEIVAKLHAKQPQDRYQTAGEVGEVLGQHLGRRQRGGHSSRAATGLGEHGNDRPAESEPQRRRTLSTLLACVCLMLLAIVSWRLIAQKANGVTTNPESSPSPGSLGSESKFREPIVPGTGRVTQTDSRPSSGAEIAPSAPMPEEPQIKLASGEPSAPSALANFALEFNGNSDYVALPDLTYDGSHPLTIECWATPMGKDSHMQRFLISNGDYVGKRELGFSLYEMGNRYPNPDFTSWAFGYSDQMGGRGSLVASPQSWAIGKTTHVAITIDGDQWRFYAGGSLWRRGKMQDKPSRSEKSFFIGRHPVFKGFYSGTIDEVRVSDVARYRDDFVPADRFTPDEETLALYHCDQGQGGVLHDSSSHAHHGKIVGASWIRVQPR
ncbi:hypothetical protein AYO47_01620 [Planctomyces sp. SCGC AG-212-M04]|nr:hypothetical protein AYO47_01620 [Planctomyces sp. SCGC AG-212-M04]